MHRDGMGHNGDLFPCGLHVNDVGGMSISKKNTASIALNGETIRLYR